MPPLSPDMETWGPPLDLQLDETTRQHKEAHDRGSGRRIRMKASLAPLFPNTPIHFSPYFRSFISEYTQFFSCCSAQSQRPGDTGDGRHAASQGPAQAAQEV
jgi:hypothetical protein